MTTTENPLNVSVSLSVVFYFLSVGSILTDINEGRGEEGVVDRKLKIKSGLWLVFIYLEFS